MPGSLHTHDIRGAYYPLAGSHCALHPHIFWRKLQKNEQLTVEGNFDFVAEPSLIRNQQRAMPKGDTMYFAKTDTYIPVPVFHIFMSVGTALSMGLMILIVQSTAGGNWIKDYFLLTAYAVFFSVLAIMSARLKHRIWLRQMVQINSCCGCVFSATMAIFMLYLATHP